MNIILIGMAGSGKSTIGKLLAKKMGRKLIETDKLVEEKCKMSISEIVEKSGWDKFRDLESEIIAKISTSDNSVISTGGGVVIRDINISKLEKNGILIWLKAKIENLAERLGNGQKRPLFQKPHNIKKEITRVYTGRKNLYKEAASFVITTDDKDAEHTTEEIISVLKRENYL